MANASWHHHVRVGGVAVLCLAIHTAHAAWSDVPPPIRGKVAVVVGRVGSLWEKDQRLVAFHEDLADRYKDTPPLEAFRDQEQWVSVFTSNSLRFPGSFSGRSKASDRVARGDIVRMRLSNFRKVASYFELPTIEAVLCRAGSPEYEACAKDNPLSWLDADGRRMDYRP